MTISPTWGPLLFQGTREGIGRYAADQHLERRRHQLRDPQPLRHLKGRFDHGWLGTRHAVHSARQLRGRHQLRDLRPGHLHAALHGCPACDGRWPFHQGQAGWHALHRRRQGDELPFTYDKSRFDPLINISYDAADGISLYAKYSTGYRAGGANSRSATFQAFDAEEVKAYELGAKMDLLDRRLRVNLAAYAMDRDNTQIDFDSVDTTPGSPTQGAHTEETKNSSGTSRSRALKPTSPPGSPKP
uniref:TonB-dependent receptor n=1 Tax=Phenylobacterium glaciei TaxID=2803784 RepID=A0A974P543_9CAUL|nr:TonB-dependent receptor [Phenylobacterium glaciei]